MVDRTIPHQNQVHDEWSERSIILCERWPVVFDLGKNENIRKERCVEVDHLQMKALGWSNK